MLENIRSLENLSLESGSQDLFKEYVLAWVAFLNVVGDLCNQVQLDPYQLSGTDLSWGRTAPQVFKKSQVMTGFEAALGKLKEFCIISQLGDAAVLTKRIVLGTPDPADFLVAINSALEWIKLNTKKIGSAQRVYFLYFFRELFNSQTDAYLNLNASAAAALHKVKTQILWI